MFKISKKIRILKFTGIIFLVIAGLNCGFALNVDEMNNEYFQSTYGFQIGDTCWSHFGAGTQWSNFGAGTQWSNFGAGTQWSNFGAGTQWSNFGACVTNNKTTTTAVGMQKTGIPFAAIALALLLFTVGLILPRMKQFRDFSISFSTLMINIWHRG